MKIWYISNSKIPSRAANSIHAMKMCQGYASLGHQVTLIVPDWQEDVERGVEDLYSFYGVRRDFQVRKIFLPQWKRLDFLHRAVMMPLFAFAGTPSLVHSRSISAAWGMTKLFGLPTIFEIHQPPSTNAKIQKLFQQTIKSRHLQALVVITQALADHMRPLLPQNIRMLIAPDGVNGDWLQRMLSPQEARAQIGLQSENRRLAVYTGHLYSGRGIELIIDLARQVKDHLFLVVGGSESDKAHYQQLAGESSNLMFVGFKPPGQMFLYLQAADVLLMPYGDKVSISGGGDTAAFASPMKMFEYMSAGRPIVASRLPVLQEVLKDGISGILLPHDQVEYWKDALRLLEKDPMLANALARQARLDAAQYTWENRARRLLEQSGFGQSKMAEVKLGIQ